VIAAPDDVHHVTQSRLADFAAEAVAIDVEELLHGKNALAANDVAQLLFAVRQALAENAFGLFLKLWNDGLGKLLAVFGATAAPG